MKQSEASAFGDDVISTFQDSSQTMAVVNTLSFNMHGLLFAMLNSIKQLDSIVTDLQKQLNEANTNLQQQINDCCTKGSTQKTTGQNSTDENNANAEALLYQNTPNPFSRETQIKCFIPANAMVSDVFIYDMQGKQLMKIQINGKGEETITIQSSELIAGMYMYTLIIDGKEIDTKKMILTD